MLVHRRASRLDDIAVAAADAFFNVNLDFTVAKAFNRTLSQLNSDDIRDFLRKTRI